MKGVKFTKVSVNNACARRNSAREILDILTNFVSLNESQLECSVYKWISVISTNSFSTDSLLLASEEENLNDNPKSRLCCPCLRHYEGQLALSTFL